MSALFFPFLLLALDTSRMLDDRDLARRIRDGDIEAFRAFFDRHHGILYGYLVRRGLPEPVAEDLVQQAFVYLWEHRDEIDADRSIRAFLFTMAHRWALNHFRDTKRLERLKDIEPTAAAASPAETAAFSLLQDRLDEAVSALPRGQRAVFELCFMQGLTYREAAEVLGIRIKTVENQMGKALKSIRAKIKVFVE